MKPHPVDVIRWRMRNVKSENTTPEKILRRALRQNGLRFQLHRRAIEGKPDIVFATKKLAIFIDGDFWHGYQWRKRGLSALEEQFKHTKTRSYWLAKIRRNMGRDCIVTARLVSQGWSVIRFWESELNYNLEKCVSAILKILKDSIKINNLAMVPSKTFAEFFAGIGLMRLGLEREGWTIEFANDIDHDKLEMYQAHFNDAEQHFTREDIHRLRSADIPTTTLATASFPCNDLSLAGGRQGLAGAQSSAFWGFIKLVEGLGKRKPPLILIENVTGFLTSHKGEDFRQALLALNKLNYSVDAFIIDASYFVPQSRQRLFVVGIQQNPTQITSKDSFGFYESQIRPKALAEFIFGHSEIKWNVRPLPTITPIQSTLEDILENLPSDDPVWWNSERTEYLINQMSPRHRCIADGMISKRKWSFGTIFRRVRNGRSMAELRIDGLAGCLRTPRGGSGRQILFKAGYGKYFARLLTPRECARLMGADEFTITTPLNQALFGFGDAVCVPVIAWIAKHYLNPVVTELMHGVMLRAPVKKYA